MAKPSFFGTIRRFFGDYLTNVSGKGPLGDLLARATTDAALRQRLIANPAQVLAEAGVQLPEGFKVEVLENTDTTIHLVLPPLLADREPQGGAA